MTNEITNMLTNAIVSMLRLSGFDSDKIIELFDIGGPTALTESDIEDIKNKTKVFSIAEINQLRNGFIKWAKICDIASISEKRYCNDELREWLLLHDVEFSWGKLRKNIWNWRNGFYSKKTGRTQPRLLRGSDYYLSGEDERKILYTLSGMIKIRCLIESQFSRKNKFSRIGNTDKQIAKDEK